MSSSQHVQMQMNDRLSSVPAGVGHHPIARSGDPFLIGYLGRGLKETAQKGLIPRPGLAQGADMPFGDDQDMNRGLGVEVLEGQDLLILQDHLRRDLAGSDFAENTVAQGSPRDAFSSIPLRPNRRASSW